MMRSDMGKRNVVLRVKNGKSFSREGRWMMRRIVSLVMTVLVSLLALSLVVPASMAKAEIVAFTQGKNFPGSGVSAIGKYRDLVFLGTLTKGIFQFDPAKSSFRSFYPAEFEGDRVNSFAVFKGKLYIGGKNGLYVYDGTKLKKKKKIGKIFLKNVYLVVDDVRDILLVESMSLSGGLLAFDGNNWKFIGGDGKGLFNDITSFAVAKEGVYLGSLGGALYLFDGKTIELAAKEFFPSNVLSIAVYDGDVYVGTGKGLFKVVDGKVSRIGIKSVGSVPFYSLVASGDVLYCATPKGIVRIRGRKAEILEGEKIFGKGKVRVLFSSDESLFAGTLDGFLIIKGW